MNVNIKHFACCTYYLRLLYVHLFGKFIAIIFLSEDSDRQFCFCNRSWRINLIGIITSIFRRMSLFEPLTRSGVNYVILEQIPCCWVMNFSFNISTFQWTKRRKKNLTQYKTKHNKEPHTATKRSPQISWFHLYWNDGFFCKLIIFASPIILQNIKKEQANLCKHYFPWPTFIQRWPGQSALRLIVHSQQFNKITTPGLVRAV